MKIQTEFDKKIKEVYEIIALPYPPRTLNIDSCPEEKLEFDDNIIELKPFNLKNQSYNIQKDELTIHRTSKQLTKFFSECERRRRANDEIDTEDQDLLKYKENVVHFIESLSSKAKVEKAHDDSLHAAKLKEQKAELLSDIRRSSNAIHANKEQQTEQQRRIEHATNEVGLRETIGMVKKLVPIHENLIASFRKKSKASQDVESKKPVEEKDINNKMKNLLNSAKTNGDDEVLTHIDGNVMVGAGHIGRTVKRGNTAFQSNLSQVAEGARRKSTVQAELISNMTRKKGNTKQATSFAEKANKDKMSVVLESVMHKVAGQEVEKQVEEEQQMEKLKIAKEDTLEKIKDYGKRKEVLENADTSYLTNTVHDESAIKGKAALLARVTKYDKNPSDAAKKLATNPVIAKLAKRRPTGPPKPVGLQAGKKQGPTPTVTAMNKPTTAVISAAVNERKARLSVGCVDTSSIGFAAAGSKFSGKGSGAARTTPSPNTVTRKTSGSTPSPNTGSRKIGGPNTGDRKISGQSKSPTPGDRKISGQSKSPTPDGRKISGPSISPTPGGRKISGPSISPTPGGRKISGSTPSPSIGTRKTSEPTPSPRYGTRQSPGTSPSPSAGGRKTSVPTTSTKTGVRKASDSTSSNLGSRRPSAGTTERKPTTGQRWK